MPRIKRCLEVFFIFSTVVFFATAAFNDKVLLSDVKAITLHQGKMTNARRSSPVPQLKCVGGSAQHRFQPKVVQCINQGSDGFDIQWECKTDMDNSYRFGHVEVTCEGYDYPNDPFVLKGSCGLEYTVDFTEQGYKKERERNGGSYSYNYQDTGYDKHSEGGLGGLVVFAGICFVIYFIYKTCLAPHIQTDGSNQHYSHATPTAPPQPPPYGFRPEFTHDQASGSPPGYPPPSYESSTGYSGSSGSHKPHSSTNQENSTGGGGGFWTGAATGGILGYLFGQNQNRGYNHGSSWGSPHNYHGASNWGFSAGPSNRFRSSSSSSSSSTGSRMTSGFGGTSRR